MGLNVHFVGRLGRDAEKHESKTPGVFFATYTIAVDDFNVETKQNETVWVRVVDWSDRTLNMLQYLKKGTLLYVQGSLKTSMYQGKNGIQISNDVRAYFWDFVRSGKREDDTASAQPQQQAQAAPTQAVPQPQVAPQVAQPTVPTTGMFMPPKAVDATTVAANSSVDDLPF